MTSTVVSNSSEIRELTIDELDEASGGIIPLVITAAYLGVCFLAGYGAVSLAYGP
jgi:hypothetical protein